MIRRFAMTACSLLPLGLLLWVPSATGQEHWVATWAASPQQSRVFGPAPGGRGGPGAGPGGPAAPAAPAGPGAPTAGAPPRAPLGPPPPSSFNNQTIRMIVRTSIGGRRLRVELSNAFGTAALSVGAAHVAVRGKESAIVADSDRALTFNGKPSVSIPPAALVVSDPVDLDVAPLSDLAVSLYLPGETGPPTTHGTGLHTNYISKGGDLTAAPALTETTTSQSWYYLSGIDVLAPADAGVVVAFGDSITDGATSTVDTDSSWPSALARRLAANPATAHLAIVNQGISGNRLLRDGAGINALARFDRDVLAQPGVRWVTLMEGINDIGVSMRTPAEAVTADDVIGALRQLADRAHQHGVKVIGCTLTPYQGAAYYSEAGEVIRQAVNQWIRTGGAFDTVADFDAVVRDPANPKQIRADFNIRDHLHPNDAGYKAMAESIDLALFAAKSR